MRKGSVARTGLHKKVQPNGFQVSDVECSTWGTAEDAMQDSKAYRQYADDCRRIAETMAAKDKAIMLEMAKVWDERAIDAERAEQGKNNRA